jgi:hypothetical protein
MRAGLVMQCSGGNEPGDGLDGSRPAADGGRRVDAGALTVMDRLCEQDPTLAEATAHVVRTALSKWQDDGSSAPALEEAAGQLLDRLDAPLADKPT